MGKREAETKFEWESGNIVSQNRKRTGIDCQLRLFYVQYSRPSQHNEAMGSQLRRMVIEDVTVTVVEAELGKHALTCTARRTLPRRNKTILNQ